LTVLRFIGLQFAHDPFGIRRRLVAAAADMVGVHGSTEVME
jgi:hypothetical protein